ncbi:hypothetical protein QZH41_009999, partial [Actinostola sp. cb2023]
KKSQMTDLHGSKSKMNSDNDDRIVHYGYRLTTGTRQHPITWQTRYEKKRRETQEYHYAKYVPRFSLPKPGKSWELVAIAEVVGVSLYSLKSLHARSSDTNKPYAAMAEDKALLNINDALQSLPIDMMKFSLYMRSLYVEKAVGTDSAAARKFRQLRDDTRNDAMVYLKGMLPVSKKLVSAIDDYFDYYDGLAYEEWLENLPDILEETQGYRELCEIVVKMHEGMLTPLKQREDKAKEVMLELTELQKEYDKKKKELEASAEDKNDWALGLAFIPGVNLIASPLLLASANKDMAEATASCAQAKLQEAAALLVKEELIPCLKAFISGLEKVAGFFSIMENQLQQFIGKGEKSQENPKKLHYTMMKKKAKELRSNCQSFMAVLPAVRTNFEAIPTEGTDKNYIDRWLEKQKQIIEKECRGKVNSFFSSFLKSIKN